MVIPFFNRSTSPPSRVTSPKSVPSCDAALQQQIAQQRLRFAAMLLAAPDDAKVVLDVANDAMRALGW